jgi:hypothetical protein
MERCWVDAVCCGETRWLVSDGTAGSYCDREPSSASRALLDNTRCNITYKKSILFVYPKCIINIINIMGQCINWSPRSRPLSAGLVLKKKAPLANLSARSSLLTTTVPCLTIRSLLLCCTILQNPIYIRLLDTP